MIHSLLSALHIFHWCTLPYCSEQGKFGSHTSGKFEEDLIRGLPAPPWQTRYEIMLRRDSNKLKADRKGSSTRHILPTEDVQKWKQMASPAGEGCL